MQKYAKALAGLSGVLIVLGEALRDGSVSGQEGFSLLVSLGVAFGVYRVPNKAA